jgi:hypothetical protein
MLTWKSMESAPKFHALPPNPCSAIAFQKEAYDRAKKSYIGEVRISPMIAQEHIIRLKSKQKKPLNFF